MLISEFTASEVMEKMPLKALRHVKVAGREGSLIVYCPDILSEHDIEVSGKSEVY